MALDDDIQNSVILIGGIVAGVDCPECEFASRDVNFESHSIDEVTCPDCGATILTEDQRSQLRRTGKL